MRIAVFCKKTKFHQGFGGMEVQNELLCKGLASRGHEIVVFSPKNDVTQATIVELGIKYIFVPSQYRFLFSTINKNSWYNKSFEAFKLEHSVKKFDKVLSQSSAGIGIIERKDEIGIKVVSVAHGSAMGEFRTYLMNANYFRDFPKIILNLQYALRQFFGRQRQYVLHSNKVVAVSNAVKEQLTEETFPPDDLITVIHNGIESFDTTSNESQKFKKLVYFGQLAKDKGVDLFFDIIADPRFKDYEMDIIGGGPLLPQFHLASTEHKNSVKINVLGKMPHEQVIEKLKHEVGSVFLFPTRRVEGFPMVLVEAMFAHLPVVAFDLGGVSDAISDGHTGYLIKAGDKKGFINKVLELSENPVKIMEMGNAAHTTALKNFDLTTMLNKYEEILK